MKTPFHRTLAVTGALAAVALVVTGCSGTNSTTAGDQDELDIAVASAPLSLDPAKAQNSEDGQTYTDLAYGSLLTLGPDGEIGPGIASEWEYTDETLTAFSLTLRDEAKFSSGQPVTSEDVKKSIERAKTESGVAAPYAAMIESIETPDPQTVLLHLPESNPNIADVLTQRYLVGSIVGPDGTGAPDTLGTTTDGAGPYMIDPTATVANDHYTYVPNPNYWDAAAVHFDKVNVRVIPNAQTRYNALKSGQADYIGGSFSTVDQAESDGFSVYSAVSSWYGIFPIDRDGDIVPALKSQEVRQALNYAVDRDAIAQAMFGEYGVPTDEVGGSAFLDDGAGYEPYYSYDLDKAKQLLEDAGFGDGFTVSIAAVATYGDGEEIAQAIAADWAKIGVTADIRTFPNLGALVGPLTGGELPAFAGNLNVQPMFLEATQILDEDAGFFNLFGSADDELSALLADARAQVEPERIAQAWELVNRRVTELGWFIPVAAAPAQYYAVTGLEGIELSSYNFVPDPSGFHY